MFKWMVSRVTDLLIAFTLATLLVWFGLIKYPELFPQRLAQYWSAVTPVTDVSQVQR